LKTPLHAPWRRWSPAVVAGLALVAGWLIAEDSKKPRIVSLTPNVTEIIVGLGATDLLVGVSDYCSLPDGKALPKCGGVMNANFERILAQQPTHLLLLGRMEKVDRFAKEHGIRPVSVNVDSFADLLREIRGISTLVDRQEAADRMIRDLQAELERVRSRSATLPKYRCLISLGNEGGTLKRIMSVGGSSFLSEMLEVAGGSSLFPEQKQPYFAASLESVVAMQPEVIFDLRPGKSFDKEQIQRIHEEWVAGAMFPAIRHNRVVMGTEGFLTTPGPKMVKIAEFFQTHLRRFAEKEREKAKGANE